MLHFREVLQRLLVRFAEIGAVLQGPAQIVTALLLQPRRSYIYQRLVELASNALS